MLLRKKKKDTFLKPYQQEKNGIKFSFVHKVTPFFVLIVSCIIATQKCAKQLNYDPYIIGKPLFIFHGEPFYPFWNIITAYITSISKFSRTANDIVYNNFKIVLFGILLAVITYYLLVYVRSLNDEADRELLANGHLGDKKSLLELGLRADCGVVIGQGYDAVIDASMQKGSCSLNVKKTSYLIQYNTNVCGMLMAGTRLGKGVSTVVPTHINYPASIISVDPKGENYEITAGWRSLFTYIYKYCPVSKDTLCFNVLDEIEENSVFRDANMIATILTAPTNPEANADPHWQETAKVLITATIMHVKCCADIEDKSLVGVYKYLSQANASGKDDDNAKKTLLQNMINSKHCTEEIHSSIVSYASQILSAADEEMGSIYSSALEALAIFNDDKVAYASNKSDFCLSDFKYSDTPISWYLTIPFPDLDRLKSLLRLIIEFVCRKFSQEVTSHGQEPLKNRLLIIIDEFPTLGKMETIETFAGILNGFFISFLWICQSKAQIDKLYGQNAPILEHCRFMWTYAMSDDNVAEYFSKRVGSEGIIKQNTSTSGSRYDVGMNNLSVSKDITERRILTANQIETMPCDTELVFTQGGLTHLAKKVAYYSDPRFMDKVRLPKPETREELLAETLTSRVLRDGDDKWWMNFEKANICNYEKEISESDLDNILSNKNDITEKQNNEEDNEPVNNKMEAGLLV